MVTSPLDRVQRSTGVPSGAVPKGSTLVVGPEPSAAATPGATAPLVSRPAPTATTSGRVRRRTRGRGTGRTDERLDAGMGPPGRNARRASPPGGRRHRGDARHTD